MLNYGALGNGTHIDDTAIIKAIDSVTAKGGIVYLPAGTYLVKRSLVIPRRVTLRGDGADNSMIKFNLGGSGDCITITGSTTGSAYSLSGSTPVGRNYVDVPGHNFTSGNWIRIYQNDSNFINDSWSSLHLGQICKIDSIQSNRIYLNRPMRIYLSSTLSPKAIKINPADSVGIEDLRLIRRDATSGQTSNFNFTYSTNSWLYGVQSDSCNFAHVSLNQSSNILIFGCYFSTAFAYGGGGQGYGVSTQFASGQNLIENTIFRRLRHSMLYQACANGNVAAYNYSLDPLPLTFGLALSSEIVLHGNYNYRNLFEGNICQNMIIDNSHGKNGMHNTFFRNRASGTNVGLYMTSSTSDSQNFVGNEVGNYVLAGTGHFQHNNNKNGTFYASGTTSLNDTSYYLENVKPTWWNISGNWPSIGGANTLNSGSNPAKERYLGTGSKTLSLGYGTSLPVTWLSFKAIPQGPDIHLLWQTASEQNADVFEIQRSTDGLVFDKIGLVKATGNSDVIRNYAYLDTETSKEINYYRIKQLDWDGKFSYSRVIAVRRQNLNGYTLYPNPCSHRLNFDISGHDQSFSVKISDSYGHIIMEFIAGSLAQNNTWDTGHLAEGIYLVEIANGHRLVTEKLVVTGR